MVHKAVSDGTTHRPAAARPAGRKTLSLPPLVYTPADVARLVRELDQINQTLLQLGLRGGGAIQVPKTSRLMDLTVEYNGMNLLRADDRKLLKRFLELAIDKAPRLHFSFSADPSVSFMEKLVTWLRKEIHPHVLVTVGLQPTIGAGCIMRSTNRYFDFSLQQTFVQQHGLLLDKLLPKQAQA